MRRTEGDRLQHRLIIFALRGGNHGFASLRTFADGRVSSRSRSTRAEHDLDRRRAAQPTKLRRALEVPHFADRPGSGSDDRPRGAGPDAVGPAAAQPAATGQAIADTEPGGGQPTGEPLTFLDSVTVAATLRPAPVRVTLRDWYR